MAVEPEEIGVEEYNRRISNWGGTVTKKLKDSARMVAGKGEGELAKSIRSKTGKLDVEIDKIAFHFVRHGVFAEKGVGRGYIMSGGTVVRGFAPGKVLKMIGKNKNRRVGEKVIRDGSINRKPAHWFNPVVEENVPQLADIVAEMDADKVVNTTKILIR
jgi:hypothetical protein